MTQAWKKGMALFIAAVLSLGMLGAIPGTAPEAHAATKPYMKSLKVKWDLKKGKSLKITENFANVGKKAYTVKLKKSKTSNSSIKGYKKFSCTLEVKTTWKPSKNQVHKMATSSIFKKEGYAGNSFWWNVVDYSTGKAIPYDDEKVFVEVGVVDAKSKAYKDNDGHRVYIDRTMVVEIEVNYPKNHKGLCLGVGGNNLTKNTKTDDAFWDGKKPFGKTSYYKKGKTNSHWMRIK